MTRVPKNPMTAVSSSGGRGGAAETPHPPAAAGEHSPPSRRGAPSPSPEGGGAQSSPPALPEDYGAGGARERAPGTVLRPRAGALPPAGEPLRGARTPIAAPLSGTTRAHPLAAAMSEADLERHVRAILKDLSEHVLGYHTYFSKASHAGFPDWVFAGPGGVLFRELKTARGRLTVTQVMWRRTLREGGADVDVWRPEDLLSGRVARELAAIAGIGRRAPGDAA
jgi:hypothetical protein